MSSNVDTSNEYKFYFILGALMFFGIPIRFPNPETRTQREFQNFLITFNRTYHGNSTEYQRRYNIFKSTFDAIDNLRQDNRPVFGINHFSDMSVGEFKKKYLLAESLQNFSIPKKRKLSPNYRYMLNNFGTGPVPLPERVDWRERGTITPVRNQGVCGSCYAQSVISNVEAMYAQKWNTTIELSVQQMIDCAGNLNFGCIGGDTCHLLEWLKKEDISILPESNYTFLGHQNVCRSSSPSKDLTQSSKTVRVVDYTCSSFVGQEHEMLAFLAFKGPLIASVNAMSWKQYVGGVIKHDCHGLSNHAVQIVGYDLSGKEEPHFIVRNSWGTSFGYHGYAKIAIGGNVCCIAEEVSSVTID